LSCPLSNVTVGSRQTISVGWIFPDSSRDQGLYLSSTVSARKKGYGDLAPGTYTRTSRSSAPPNSRKCAEPILTREPVSEERYFSASRRTRRPFVRDQYA